MRRKIIAGNWKMNMTPTEAKALATTLAPLVKNPEVDVVYCVPFIDIFPVKEVIAGTAVHLAQRMSTSRRRAPSPARPLRPC